MIHASNYASSLRLQVASLSALIAGLVLASAASAVDLDFNVASGNFNVASNWVDATTGAVSASAPTIVDNAFVRNNGTLLIDTPVEVLQMRIGYEREFTNPDYNDNGTVDAADYVLWRNGGPLAHDLTPTDVGPEDYTYWRFLFGQTGLQSNLGKAGTLNWTAGEITGRAPFNGPYSGGPDIRVGRVDTTQVTASTTAQYEFTGTVVQNGATTKLLLPYSTSKLTIGDGVGFVHNPTSSYTLVNGTIGLGIGVNGFTTDGANSNNGIDVRNGTFNMSGGQIIDATPTDYFTIAGVNNLADSRFLSVAGATGGGVGNENVSTANITGGTIDVLGGIRVATASHTRGFLNMSGATTSIITGRDTSIGYQPKPNVADPTKSGVNAIGEMNMSGGSLQVGRTDTNPQTGTPYSLKGKLAIGDQGPGKLNMSGGSITVNTDVLRVGNKAEADGSSIYMTGGSITTISLDMRTDAAATPANDVGVSIILDGPTASFTQSRATTNPEAYIGRNGKALFEVRQGTALLGGQGSRIDVAGTVNSAATINVKGGKLTLGGPLNRSNLGAAAPTIGLTGGTLEFNNTTLPGAHIFYADLKNAGSKLIAKPNAVQLVQVGSMSPAIPANFEMTGGSWDIEIGSHTALGGADWFSVPNGNVSLTGGTLNISTLPLFTPNPNEVFTILQGSGTVTLGAATIGTGSPNWSLQINPSNSKQIQLKYIGSGSGIGTGGSAVPEPSSVGARYVCRWRIASRKAVAISDQGTTVINRASGPSEPWIHDEKVELHFMSLERWYAV